MSVAELSLNKLVFLFFLVQVDSNSFVSFFRFFSLQRLTTGLNLNLDKFIFLFFLFLFLAKVDNNLPLTPLLSSCLALGSGEWSKVKRTICNCHVDLLLFQCCVCLIA